MFEFYGCAKMLSIVSIKTHTCHRCGSTNIIKNGKNVCGSQQYRCKDCNITGVLEPKNSYSEADKDHYLSLINEGMSMRGITRQFGVSLPTLIRWVKKRQAKSV